MCVAKYCWANAHGVFADDEAKFYCFQLRYIVARLANIIGC